MTRIVVILLVVGAAILIVRSWHANAPGGAGADPWDVLGVRRGASRDEITRAYRDRLKEYHPDRVAQLGADLRKLAHEKTVEIRKAYEALSGRG